MGNGVGLESSPCSASAMYSSCIASFDNSNNLSKEGEIRKLSFRDNTFLKIKQNLDLNTDLPNSKIYALS